MVSWFRKLSARLHIWFLRLTLRILQTSRFQKIVFRPFLRIGLYWFMLTVMLDRLPKGWEENPKIAHLMAQLRATWNGQANWMNDRGRAVDQTLTWGVAGGGVVMLTAIVIAHTFSRATWVAAICLSLSIPFLIVLGAIPAFQTDEQAFPLSVRDMLIRTAALWLTQFIFYTGLIAFLWSYDDRVAIAFLAGSYLAWRYFRRIVTKYHGLPKNKTD
jgi:hypothetical protein